MKKCLIIAIAFALVMAVFPPTVLAASVSFKISGPATLAKGQVGTYTVSVTVNDAAAAYAQLTYDSNFFELVSGNTKGVWDTSGNTSGTFTMTTVELRCKADPGSSGALSLTGLQAGRLTGDMDNPVEPVQPGGASLTVKNPAPTPPSTPTPTPKPKPTPTRKPAATPTPTIEPSPTIEPTPTPTPTPEPPMIGLEALIADMEPGGTLKADMRDDPHIPASTLKALKEKQGVLEIDLGGYTCKIDGKDLGDIPADIDAIDLGLSMTKDAALSSAAGGSDVYQLRFNHEGELPGKFTFVIKADQSQPGDEVYLYYYYGQAGVVEGKQSAIVDQDGYVAFEIYHCSAYFIAAAPVEGAMNNFSALEDEPVGPAMPGQPQDVSFSVLILSVAGGVLLSSLVTVLIYRARGSKAAKHLA